MKTFSGYSMRTVLAIAVIGALFAVAYFTNPSFLKAPPVESAVVTSPNVSGWVWSLGTGSGVADNPAGPYSIVAGSNPGLGWFSFNCTDTNSCATYSYGVKVDTTTKGTGGIGNFSGNAWIGDSNIAGGYNTGWVSFDRSETGNPPSNDPGSGSGRIAQVDWSTGKVYGWMRVLTGADPQAGGWDGWIKLSEWTGTPASATYTASFISAGLLTPSCPGDTSAWDHPSSGSFTGANVGSVCYDQYNTPPDPTMSMKFDRTASTPGSPVYGVSISANKFSGYAWGGEVVGWVDFAPKIGGVSVGPVVGAPPCVATDPSISWGACQPLVSCPTTDTTGIQVGACPTGGTVTRSCTTPARVCASAPAGPAGTCGDGVCNSGETPLSCAKDCKLKFKQF